MAGQSDAGFGFARRTHVPVRREVVRRKARVQHCELLPSGRDSHRIEQILARGRLLVLRQRCVQEQHEALPVATTDFVIAARGDPRRGFEQRLGRFEEVQLPSVPVVVVWRDLAIDVVADVHQDLRLALCDARREPRERPRGNLIAVLEIFVVGGVATLHPATCVADDRDGCQLFGRKAQLLAVQFELLRAGLDKEFADQHRKRSAVAGAGVHQRVPAVDFDGRASGRVGVDRAGDRPLRPEHDVGVVGSAGLCGSCGRERGQHQGR